VRVRRGSWQRIRRGVLLVAGTADTWEQRLWVALLAAGPRSVASHRSAGRLWRLPDCVSARIEVTVLRHDRADVASGRCRETLALDPGAIVAGFPVTTIERTLLDLGAFAPRLVRSGIDDALGRTLTTLPRLQETLRTVGRRGRAGTAAFRQAVDAAASAPIELESELERRFERLLRTSGLPLPDPQHRILLDSHRTVRVDFAYVHQKLAIELDGFAFHGRRLAWESDLDRHTRLAVAGWTVLRFTWTDVTQRPAHVISTVSDALARTFIVPAGVVRSEAE